MMCGERIHCQSKRRPFKEFDPGHQVLTNPIQCVRWHHDNLPNPASSGYIFQQLDIAGASFDGGNSAP